MPRQLKFELDGKITHAHFQKISRDMLYGKSSLEYRGEEGEVYQNVLITSDGAHLLTSGGIGSNYLTPKGRIPEEIVKVDDQGKELTTFPSMFNEPISLHNTLSLQEYLHYKVEYSYIIKSEENLAPIKKKSAQLWKEGKLLSFPYAYYETTQTRDAVLILKNDTLFVLVGTYQKPQLLSQEQVMFIDETIEEQLHEEIAFEVW
jgi:hypothetical protein